MCFYSGQLCIKDEFNVLYGYDFVYKNTRFAASVAVEKQIEK